MRIGEQRKNGATRDVFFTTWAAQGGFQDFLQSRRPASRGTFVLAPVRRRRLPPGIEERHGPGALVELAFLEDLIEVRNGRLTCAAARPAPVTHHEPPVADDLARPAFCVLVDQQGTRNIDRQEHREILRRAETFHLFIDSTTPVEAGKLLVGRKLLDGTFERSTLTRQRASALIELIERRQPLRAAELRAISAYGNPQKQFEAARREVDVRLGRYEWRAFKLIRGDTSQANRNVFSPPPDLTFAVMRPAGGSSG